MASISRLKRKKGTVYRAQIRIHRDGRLAHSEAATFSTRAAARRWADAREDQLKAPGGLRRHQARRSTLRDLITRYVEENGASFGRSKRMHLESLLGHAISHSPLSDLTSEAFLEHVRDRREHVAPSTAGQDLTYIRVVLEHAALAWGMDVDLGAIDRARLVARKSRLTGISRSRDRRPTNEELSRLYAWFDRPRVGRGARTDIPMSDTVAFAVASTRRQGEITRLMWSDLDEKDHTCLLRDAKSPTGSLGNHRVFALTREAMAIIQRQPRCTPLIFPYNPQTIGCLFRRACTTLGITDLTFHDLRHEGTSRLFEAGYQIQEVQQFTLHDQWSTLQRYTQLRPESVAGR